MTPYTPETPISPKTVSQTPFLVAAVASSTIAALAVLLVIILGPKEDRQTNVLTIMGIFTPLTSAIIAYMVQSTHKIVNSQMDAFREELRQSAGLAALAAYNEGLSVGKTTGAANANARTDVLAAGKQ